MFFYDFRYFLTEIEGLEQKSDSEVEEGLLILLDSDLPTLKVARFQLRWKVDIQGFPAMYNSPYFGQE